MTLIPEGVPWLAGALLLCACGAPAVPEARPSRSGSRGAASLPVDPTPGYRARLRRGPDPESRASSWADIVVPDETDRGRATCIVVLEAERATTATAGITTEVARPCEATPLPPVALAGRSVLRQSRTLSDVDIAMLGAAALADHPMPGNEALIASFTAFGDAESCDAMRERLVQAQEEANRSNAENAERFLDGVIGYHEGERDEVCVSADDAEPTRSCANERALIAMLEARRGTPPVEPPLPECLPEGDVREGPPPAL